VPEAELRHFFDGRLEFRRRLWVIRLYLVWRKSALPDVDVKACAFSERLTSRSQSWCCFRTFICQVYCTTGSQTRSESFSKIIESTFHLICFKGGGRAAFCWGKRFENLAFGVSGVESSRVESIHKPGTIIAQCRTTHVNESQSDLWLNKFYEKFALIHSLVFWISIKLRFMWISSRCFLFTKRRKQEK
jgi:hypothetical protein